MNIGLRDMVRYGVERVVREALVDRFRLWSARVHGIEVTQSIQYFDASEHLTDANDRGMDNGVQLVAYKAAWVRVYVRSGLVGALSGVSGALTLERRNYRMTYDTVATYSPQAPGSINVQPTPAYATERGSIWRTLNFVIPASEFHGSMRLVARLSGYEGAELAVEVRANLVQTLRVRAIMVRYEGPSSANQPAAGQPPLPTLNLPAPTLAQLQATAGTAIAAMPVQGTGSFAICSNMNWFTPLDDMRSTTGGCSSNWDSFLAWLALLRDSDGNRADVARCASLQIVGPNAQKWVREAPRHQTRFAGEDARVDGERLHLRWEIEAGGGEPPQVWAQWSRARGERWSALAVDLREGRADLPLDGLPPGEVVIRLLAHDGFDTVASDVMVLELPRRAPVVAIMHPRDGQTLRSNHAFQVAGNATETDGQPLESGAIRWLLDGHQVGRGHELWLTGPPRGRHELTAQVQWEGGTVEASVRFQTEDPERPEEARYMRDAR